MATAGRLNRRVTFKQEVRNPDGQGGFSSSWAIITTVWGQYLPERAQEQVSQGRVQASSLGVLRVRYFNALAELVAEKSSVEIDDLPHNIRSIINPDQKKRMLEMVVERGVAPHG